MLFKTEIFLEDYFVLFLLHNLTHLFCNNKHYPNVINMGCWFGWLVCLNVNKVSSKLKIEIKHHPSSQVWNDTAIFETEIDFLTDTTVLISLCHTSYRLPNITYKSGIFITDDSTALWPATWHINQSLYSIKPWPFPSIGQLKKLNTPNPGFFYSTIFLLRGRKS